MQVLMAEPKTTIYDRAESLAKAIKDHGEAEAKLRERYINPIGYREVMHLSFVMHETVAHYLVEHPAVIFDEESYGLAANAADALFDLYQRLGRLEFDLEDAGRAGQKHAD